MIVSVSRRTDVPAWYADWFFNRLRAGEALVRGPYNPRLVRRVPLTPEVVDGFVFWTKNPAPMLDRLPELGRTAYYFQVTVTAYGQDLEPGVPAKGRAVVPAVRELARRIGPERVVWRYDPILLTARYSMDWHRRYFAALAHRLSGSVRRCVISFLDPYPGMERDARTLGLRPPDRDEQTALAACFAEEAGRWGMTVQTCAEAADLSRFGVARGSCIDPALLEAQLGRKLTVERDRNQRPACGCASSVDIGMYGGCGHRCRYCYAGGGRPADHDPAGPLLFGRLTALDQVRPYEARSWADDQLRLPD